MALVRGSVPRFAGLNRSHPAARCAEFLAVADGVGMTDIILGQRGTNVGTVTAAVDPFIGPVVDLSAASTGITFGGRSTASYQHVTWACLFKVVTGFGSSAPLCEDGTWVGPSGLYISGGNPAGYIINGSGSGGLSSFTPATGGVYFIASSLAGSGSSGFAFRRLDKNDYQASGSTVGSVGGLSLTPSGTIYVGQSSPGSSIRVAYAFMSKSFTPGYTLERWANDPWSIFQRPSKWGAYSSAGTAVAAFIPNKPVIIRQAVNRAGTY